MTDGRTTARPEPAGGVDEAAPMSAAAGAAPPSLDAACVHAGREDLGMATPPLAPPLVLGAVFAMPDLEAVDRAMAGEPGLWVYGRAGNPTVAALERAVAALEGAEAAVAAASGMGALAAVLHALAPPGARVLTTGALYGDTRALLEGPLAAAGMRVEHRAPAAPEGPLPPDTAVVLAEAIANPLLQVADLPAWAAACRAVGARLVVDATFASPCLCRPLDLGADVSLHSATKYLGGHGDLVLGVASGSADVMAPVRRAVVLHGAPAGPMEAWLTLRGLRTLHLRMARHAANGQAAARWLATRPDVARVWYPGLPGPDHGAARRVLAGGYGGMVAFELAGGRPAVEAFLGGLRMIRFAASLADVATTISVPALTSHRRMAPEERAAQGISDGVIRLSCGVEAAEDLIADLTRGLDAARAAAPA